VVGIVGLILAIPGAITAWKVWIDRPSSQGERAPHIQQVDLLCGQALQQFQALGPHPDNDLPVTAQHLHNMSQVSRRLLQQWTSIPTPPDDLDLLRGMWDTLERLSMQAEVAAQTARVTGDYTAVNAELSKLPDIDFEFRKDSRAYGFKVCPDV
jgi:hypothetical protein